MHILCKRLHIQSDSTHRRLHIGRCRMNQAKTNGETNLGPELSTCARHNAESTQKRILGWRIVNMDKYFDKILKNGKQHKPLTHSYNMYSVRVLWPFWYQWITHLVLTFVFTRIFPSTKLVVRRPATAATAADASPESASKYTTGWLCWPMGWPLSPGVK